MIDGVIDSDFPTIEWVEVGRLVDQPKEKLLDWVERKVIKLGKGHGPNAHTVIAAAAAGALDAQRFDERSMGRYVPLMSKHLMFHFIKQCPRAIEAKQVNRRGALVNAPRYRSLIAEDLSDSWEVEPYRYVSLDYGLFFRLSVRKGMRFPDGAPPTSIIDMKQLGKEIAQRVREPLIYTTFIPESLKKTTKKAA